MLAFNIIPETPEDWAYLGWVVFAAVLIVLIWISWDIVI